MTKPKFLNKTSLAQRQLCPDLSALFRKVHRGPCSLFIRFLYYDVCRQLFCKLRKVSISGTALSVTLSFFYRTTHVCNVPDSATIILSGTSKRLFLLCSGLYGKDLTVGKCLDNFCSLWEFRTLPNFVYNTRCLHTYDKQLDRQERSTTAT